MKSHALSEQRATRLQSEEPRLLSARGHTLAYQARTGTSCSCPPFRPCASCFPAFRHTHMPYTHMLSLSLC
eukprot:3718291-Rhodomonas_salina.1